MKRRFIQKIIVPVLVCICANSLQAQVTGNTISDEKNLVKINLPALFFKNISLQYERLVSEKRTFALAIRYRPNSAIPFQSEIEKIIDYPSIRVELFKIGNIGITPEFRFYLGKKGALHGFYIGPFISYNHYDGDVPINYNDYVNNVSIKKTAIFKGGLNTFTGGVQLGAQWQLSEHLFLDWWIVGPNYGIGKGDFIFAGTLNDIEQISMQVEIDKLKLTSPIDVIDGKTVTANGASFTAQGPWAGIRAFGINLGYRF